MVGKTELVISAVVTLCVALFALLALLASIGSAEVNQRGGVRVSVNGSLSPTSLPREGTVPIGVGFGGQISSTTAGAVPQLTSLTIAINRNGELDTRDLPLCGLGRIDPSTTRGALAACGPSLVGEGSFSANVKIPEQSPFPSDGKVLAFNGRLHGKPTIFAHIYGTKPVPTSYILPFKISRGSGTYGTLLKASFPQVTGDWGFVTGISMNLSRTFFVHGQKRGFLNAGCPAPKGLTRVAFPLARTSFAFEGGLTIDSVLNRTCRVKG